MKIVVMMNKCRHGARILEELKAHKIYVGYIVMEEKYDGPKRIARYFKHLFKGKEWWQKDKFYRQWKVKYVRNFNSKECESMLEADRPDLIILGGTRIIKKNIINVPTFGILNGHPGYLPDYRGMDVIKWAVLEEGKLGVTIHMINDKIDSGLMLNRERYLLRAYHTFDILAREAEDLIAILMAKTVIQIENSKATFTPVGKGRYYNTMTQEENENAEKKLSEIIRGY